MMNEDVVCLVWKKYMTAHVLPELLHAPIKQRLLTQSNLQCKDETVWIPHYRRFPNVPDDRVLKALVFSHDVTNVRFHVGVYNTWSTPDPSGQPETILFHVEPACHSGGWNDTRWV